LVLVDHFFGLVWNVAHLWLEELGTPMPKSMSTFKLMPKIRHGEVRAISAKTAA